MARAPPLVALRVAGEHRLSLPGHLLHHAPRDLKLGIVDQAVIHPPGHAKAQAPVLVAQHHKAAFRRRDRDHLVHHPVQHRVQIER